MKKIYVSSLDLDWQYIYKKQVEVIKDKRSETSRKFAYVTAPDQVSKESLKLNGETFNERPLIMLKA